MKQNAGFVKKVKDVNNIGYHQAVVKIKYHIRTHKKRLFFKQSLELV